MTGCEFPGQDVLKHSYQQVGGYCRRIGGILLFLNNGAPPQVFNAPTNSTGDTVSQIPAAAGTYTLLRDDAVPKGVAAAFGKLRLYLTGTAFKTVYTFTVSGITTPPTVGSTGTNNGQTFTYFAVNVVAGAGTLLATGTGAPAASGNLADATGDATVAFSAFASAAGTLTLQYNDGTLIGTVALATALGSAGACCDVQYGNTGVTVSATTAYNPRNAPTGIGIVAIMAGMSPGSAIDVLFESYVVS